MLAIKRRMPAITLPEVKAFSYALVLAWNPHGEHSTFLWEMNFTIAVVEIRTKDELHASLSLRINSIIHILMALRLLTNRQQVCCLVATKNPERRSPGSLFLHSLVMEDGGDWFARRYGLLLIRAANLAIITLRCSEKQQIFVKHNLFRFISN